MNSIRKQQITVHVFDNYPVLLKPRHIYCYSCSIRCIVTPSKIGLDFIVNLHSSRYAHSEVRVFSEKRYRWTGMALSLREQIFFLYSLESILPIDAIPTMGTHPISVVVTVPATHTQPLKYQHGTPYMLLHGDNYTMLFCMHCSMGERKRSQPLFKVGYEQEMGKCLPQIRVSRCHQYILKNT